MTGEEQNGMKVGIYALAERIYGAESSSKGILWKWYFFKCAFPNQQKEYPPQPLVYEMYCKNKTKRITLSQIT